MSATDLASRLKDRVTFCRTAPADDGLTSVPGEPAEIGQRWAQKRDLSDGEKLRAGQFGGQVTTRFLVRDDSFTRSLLTTDTLVCRGVSYSILGLKDAEAEGYRVAIEISAAAAQ